MAPQMTIVDYYKGKSLFITGATGFMGKVLVEKILRSCPDVEKVYILIRGKKGDPPQARWDKLTDLPLFDRLKETYPDALKTKVHVINGDVMVEGLGISKEDRDLLTEKTHIVFHVAASVRFDDPLKYAIRMNTFGTKQVIDLSLKMKKLEILMYVSTTYCNCDLPEVDEQVYPQDVHWKDVLSVSELPEQESINILTKKYIGKKPNTYVFSKALAEQMIEEIGDKIPTLIFRPSIVISSWKEPVSGWLDNINGPVGMLMGIGKGVLRVTLCNPDSTPDYMAVDVAIKAMIIGVWKKALSRDSPTEKLEVINASSGSKSISNREFVRMGLEVYRDHPWSQALWYPSSHITKSLFVFKLNGFFKHFLVALIVDSVLSLLGKDLSLLKVQIKVQNALIALSTFTTRSWTFHNKNFMGLNESVLPEDKEGFDYTFDYINPKEYFADCIKGGKKYLVHDPPENLPFAKVLYNRLYWLDKFVTTAFRLTLCYFAYKLVF